MNLPLFAVKDGEGGRTMRPTWRATCLAERVPILFFLIHDRGRKKGRGKWGRSERRGGGRG